MRNAANLRTTGREAAAGRTFDETAIAKLAKGAKFDKATVGSLRATAKAANEAMRVLDSFTGASSLHAEYPTTWSALQVNGFSRRHATGRVA